MTKQTLLTFVFLLVLAGNLSAQSKSVDLWSGKVPGAIPNASYKQTVDSADNWIKMRFVTEPSLDVYPAPAEKANGTAVIICPGGATSKIRTCCLCCSIGEGSVKFSNFSYKPLE